MGVPASKGCWCGACCHEGPCCSNRAGLSKAWRLAAPIRCQMRSEACCLPAAACMAHTHGIIALAIIYVWYFLFAHGLPRAGK
jgi:hypothetical protein